MDDAYLELLKKCLTASLYDESAWRVARMRLRLMGMKWLNMANRFRTGRL